MLTEADMLAEQELVDDVLRLAQEVQDDLRTGEWADAWQQRREDIAVLRERIRALRDEHMTTGARA